MKKLIIDLAKKNIVLRNVIRFGLFLKQRTMYLLNYFKKVDEKLVLFESYMGRSYACSPRAIYEYMLKEKKYKDYKFIWFFKDLEEKKHIIKDDRTTIIKYGSSQYYKAYAKAKYWFTNSRIPNGINRKKKQIYIQCWHGTPLKKLGFDLKVEGANALNSIKDIKNKYESDAKKYSYMISPSKFCTEKLISAFNLKKLNKEKIIIEKGYPRNDFLYSYTQQDVKRIRKQLKLPLNKKIILYAPTWRDNQHDSKIGYTYSFGIDFNKLKKELSNDYIILFRTHYFVSNSFDFGKYKNFIYDVSNYNDINDLYIISDLLITDYSSVFFDYANLKRPIIFYMYDFDEYKNKLRDFYIDLKELPGSIIKKVKEDELIKEIKKSKNFKYNKKYEEFNKKFNYLDNKNSSKRVIETIIKE